MAQSTATSYAPDRSLRASVQEMMDALRRARARWWWCALGTGLGSLLVLVGTFTLTLRSFRSALGGMHMGDGDLSDPGSGALAPSAPVISAEQMHAHTAAAVSTLGAGLVIFIVLFLVFL